MIKSTNMTLLLTLFVVDILTWLLFFILLGIFLSDVSYVIITGFLLNYTIHMLTTLRLVYVLEEGLFWTWWTFATFAFTFVFDTFATVFTALRGPRDPNWSWIAVLIVGILFDTVTVGSLLISTTFSPRRRMKHYSTTM